MNEKENDAWYKWRFSLGGLYLTVLFSWIAWSSFNAWSGENTNSWVYEILEPLVFLGFAIWLLSQEWKYRKGGRVDLSSSRQEGKDNA